MDKCDCWHKEERIVGWCGFSPLTKTVYECYGTKEREECQCMGDRGKCDFYPEKKKEPINVTVYHDCSNCKFEKSDIESTDCTCWNRKEKELSEWEPSEAYEAIFKDLEFRTTQVRELQKENAKLKEELNSTRKFITQLESAWELWREWSKKR